MKELQKKVFNITLKGEIEVRGKFIKHLEGGFGENCRIISVKDIALQHDMEVKHVNELINRNIKRFKENVDYIDMMSNEDLKVVANDLGLISSNRTKSIYILSERGYSKLIKIMDTDLAWEIYDDLLDGYFTLREKVKEQIKPLSTLEELRMHYQVLEQQSQEIQEVKADVADLKENMPLFNIDCKELQELVRKKGIEALGGYKSPAYNDKSTRSKVYSDIQNQLRREFGVNKYERIKHSQLELAKQIVNEYKVPIVLEKEIQSLNAQMTL